MAKGIKTGGRAKGTPNKAGFKREAEIRASGLSPLDFMLDVLRNEDSPTEERKWAAKEAAPYIHPRQSTVDVGNKDREPLVVHIRNF